jgi:hypothetical protein
MRWCEVRAHFPARPQRFIEVRRAREEMSDWIDLIFGFARDGEAAIEKLNVFSANYYPDTPRAAPDNALIICGQVPFKVFTTPHRRAVPLTAGRCVVELAPPTP